jgi:hypothetical protein
VVVVAAAAVVVVMVMVVVVAVTVAAALVVVVLMMMNYDGGDHSSPSSCSLQRYYGLLICKLCETKQSHRFCLKIAFYDFFKALQVTVVCHCLIAILGSCVPIFVRMQFVSSICQFTFFAVVPKRAPHPGPRNAPTKSPPAL